MKIKGKKQHILVDTIGLLLHVVVHRADIQHRDGSILVLGTLFGKFPFLQKPFAYGGYQGPQFREAQKKPAIPGDGNRQALGCGQRLRDSAEALDR